VVHAEVVDELTDGLFGRAATQVVVLDVGGGGEAWWQVGDESEEPEAPKSSQLSCSPVP